MGNPSSSEDAGDGDEKNAHKVLVIRTKDSSGYLLIGANKQGGYYHSKKYITFDHHDQKNVTIALSLWDTPAIDFSANVHDQVTAPYYKYAHGLFCVYNVESTESFNLMCNKISYLYKNPQKTPFKDASKVAIMLIGHKSKEFMEKNRKVSQEKAIKYANALDITFFEVDSSDWQDVSDLYTIMGKSIFQIYGQLPLHNRTSMTEIDESCDIVATDSAAVTPLSIANGSNNKKVNNNNNNDTANDDEKVNDTATRSSTPIANLGNSKRGQSPAQTQSDSDISELSDAVGMDENFQPTKTPRSMTPKDKSSSPHNKRSNHRFAGRERADGVGSTNDLPGCQSRNSESLPGRHRSTHSNAGSTYDDNRSESAPNPVSDKFREFINSRVQMPYLFELFASQHYDDIRMIEYFDDEMLQNEIGIKNLIHRKLFLQQCADFKFEIKQFKEWLTQRVQLRRYLPTFESAGLITMGDITQEILSQSDFALKLKIVNRNHQAILWQELQSYESASNDAEYVHHSESTKTSDGSPGLRLNGNAERSPSPKSKMRIVVQGHGVYGGSMTPKVGRSGAPLPPLARSRTRMGGAYAQIQRNKEIFGALSGNEKYKQETEVKKRKNSLESHMPNVEMNGGDERSWQRSSSVTSTCSEPPHAGSPLLKRQQSTPTLTLQTPEASGKDLTIKPKRKLKRRKSFGLGLK